MFVKKKLKKYSIAENTEYRYICKILIFIDISFVNKMLKSFYKKT